MNANDIINGFAYKHRCGRHNQQQMIEALVLELSGLKATLNKGKEKEKNMSYHAEIYKGVDVEWDKETGYLDIRDQDGKQLALMRVEEVD